MASSLWNLVNNLYEGIHRIKCKYKHNDENVRLVELNISIVTAFSNIQTLKMIYWNADACVVTNVINTSLTKS